MQTFKPVIRWWSLVHPGLIAHFSETLEVHADRMMYRKGIFSEKEVVVPFSRVTNYSVDQNFFDRLFGAGNFTIETAGSVAPELVLNGYPYKLRDLLAQSLNISS